MNRVWNVSILKTFVFELEELEEEVWNGLLSKKEQAISALDDQSCSVHSEHAGMGFEEAKLAWSSVLAKDVTANWKSFFRYTVSKRKARENVGLLLNRNRVLVTKDMEKAKVLDASFTSAFTGKDQPSGTPSPWEQWRSLEQGSLGGGGIGPD